MLLYFWSFFFYANFSKQNIYLGKIHSCTKLFYSALKKNTIVLLEYFYNKFKVLFILHIKNSQSMVSQEFCYNFLFPGMITLSCCYSQLRTSEVDLDILGLMDLFCICSSNSWNLNEELQLLVHWRGQVQFSSSWWTLGVIEAGRLT